MWIILALLDPNPESRYESTDLIESNPDPDPKHWFNDACIAQPRPISRRTAWAGARGARPSPTWSSGSGSSASGPAWRSTTRSSTKSKGQSQEESNREKYGLRRTVFVFVTSIPDPNPDPHGFGPPGSESGSTWFWAPRIPEVWIRIRILLSSYHQAKIVRKTFIPTVLWLLFDFLSLKNDVNIPSKSIKQKNFFLN